jgi:hypothetical protein
MFQCLQKWNGRFLFIKNTQKQEYCTSTQKVLKVRCPLNANPLIMFLSLVTASLIFFTFAGPLISNPLTSATFCMHFR